MCVLCVYDHREGVGREFYGVQEEGESGIEISDSFVCLCP